MPDPEDHAPRPRRVRLSPAADRFSRGERRGEVVRIEKQTVKVHRLRTRTVDLVERDVAVIRLDHRGGGREKPGGRLIRVPVSDLRDE